MRNALYITEYFIKVFTKNEMTNSQKGTLADNVMCTNHKIDFTKKVVFQHAFKNTFSNTDKRGFERDRQTNREGKRERRAANRDRVTDRKRDREREKGERKSFTHPQGRDV